VIPIQDLLHRIEWDAEFGRANFEIGYLDRLAGGVVRVPFTEVRLAKQPQAALQICSEAGEPHTVPLHRVRAVWRNGDLIWQRGGGPPAALSALILAGVTALILGGGTTFGLDARAGPASWPSAPGAEQSPQPFATLERVRDWAAAVEEHEIGAFDAHAARIAEWSWADVHAFIVDLPAVFRFVMRQGGKAFELRGRTVFAEEVRAALRLTDDEWQAGDVTRLVRRAALLHTDIARHGSGSAGVEWGRVLGDPRPGPSPGVVYVADGQMQSTGPADGHWRFGRYLLDRVKPAPSRDAVAVAWYRGAAAFLQSVGYFADAHSHLLDALQALPGDAVVHFYAGVGHEVNASPPVQAVLQAPQLQRGSWLGVESAEAELKQARSALSRAVDLDPGLLEARLHLGRVLGLLGRHADAARELRIVSNASRDPLMSFYADLFLGSAEEALGRLGPARTAYLSAAALYPEAQSVRMALAQLSWREGDRGAARAAILQALARTGANQADPWWTYSKAAGRHADEYFEQARRICLGEGRR